jgi:hypothetical protein
MREAGQEERLAMVRFLTLEPSRKDSRRSTAGGELRLGTFELILSLSEYEKNIIKCPKCGSEHVHQEVAAFFAVTAKKS